MVRETQGALKTMIRLTSIAAILVFLYGCGGSTNERSSEHLKPHNPSGMSDKRDTLLTDLQEEDTFKIETQNKTIDAVKGSKKNRLKEEPTATRYTEFPSDGTFNGRPMTQQIEMPAIVYENFPDTLSELAIARYRSYDRFFPKAISDNFEEGISTETVTYPEKLIFHFQLFENGYSPSPYITKDITVRRNGSGEPYIE